MEALHDNPTPIPRSMAMNGVFYGLNIGILILFLPFWACDTERLVTEALQLKVETEWPCRRADSCSGNRYCNLSNGKCEERSAVHTDEPKIFSIAPSKAAPGDTIIINGEGLIRPFSPKFNPLKMSNTELWKFGTGVSVLVDTREIHPNNIIANEFSVIFKVPEKGGPVRISRPMKQLVDSPVPLEVSLKPDSVNPCSSERPPPTGVRSGHPSDVGPYGSGYVDGRVPDLFIRIHYPSKCGGLRTAPADGVFPLVVIVHGNGLHHLNYEYLARHLSSWGYVVVVPMGVEPRNLYDLLRIGIDKPELWFAPLKNHVALKKSVMIAHSDGALWVDDFIRMNPTAPVAGVVYLGPGKMNVIPQLPTLTFAATGDRQCPYQNVKTQWDRISAKKILIEIEGGNHSQFTDSTHWENNGLNLDEIATIPRSRQFTLVQSYVLPFVQRIFSEEELFPEFLTDSQNPSEIDYTSTF